MFYRTLLANLDAWKKKSSRKPLILRGARQVGKTTLVNLFSKSFKQFISLNLDLKGDVELFENARNIDELIDAIFLYHGGLKSEPETLIFIDEIQNSSAAVKWLRYFSEEKNHLYVIAAGSLLESLIQKQVSFPVGRVEYLPLRPFSFHEFLMAAGEKESVKTVHEIPFPDYAHNKLMGLFRKYLLIGGMPEIIKNYLEFDDLNALDSIYDSLVLSFKDDVEKYAKSTLQGEILRHSIDHIFLDAGKRIKFAGFGNSNYRSREMKEALLALERALLIQLIYPVTSVHLPLQPDYRKSPKLQVVDTGLVNHVSGLKKELFGARVIDAVYEGRIAEHIVGQELISLSGSLLQKEKFWIRHKESDAEVDYLFTFNQMVIPIEVKSGGSGRLRSLHEFMDRTNHKYAIRIFSDKLSVTQSRTRNGKEYYLMNLPFFLTHRIEDYLKWLVREYV